MTFAESTQYVLKEATIETTGGPVSITAMIEEINFYDNLFLPVSSGSVIITDTANLLKELAINVDVLKFHIQKISDNESMNFQKVFVIYSITDRKNLNNTSEVYVLNFVSAEYLFSRQQKLTPGFTGKYSDLVKQILSKDLKIPNDKIRNIEESNRIASVTIPNISPFDALEWCSKRAISSRDLPEFLFFSNREGYNFASLSNLMTKESILRINFSPKNLEEDDQWAELSKARGLEVEKQRDIIDRINSGVDSGVVLGFNPLMRTFGSKPISGQDVYNKGQHANKGADFFTLVNPDSTTNQVAFNSKQVLTANYFEGIVKSKYVKENDPSLASKTERYEDILLQRGQIISKLMEKRIKVVMPGNFQLTSGMTVDLDAPGFSIREKGQDPSQDTSLSGKYIIVASRHVLGLKRFVTIIELATDSTNDLRKIKTSAEQLEAMKTYDQIRGAR
jgi:hypothetical protein